MHITEKNKNKPKWKLFLLPNHTKSYGRSQIPSADCENDFSYKCLMTIIPHTILITANYC